MFKITIGKIITLIVGSIAGIVGFTVDFQLLKADVRGLQTDIVSLKKNNKTRMALVKENNNLLCLIAVDSKSIKREKIPQYCVKK